MKELLKIGHKKESKKIILSSIFPCIILIIIFFVYKYQKTILLDFASQVKSMPKEFYILLGINPTTETGSCSFFLLYISMLLSMQFVWNSLLNTIHLIEENEHSGRLYRICNQLYSRKQIFYSLYIKAFLQFLISYLIWGIFLLALFFICSINPMQKKELLNIWAKMISMNLLTATAYISAIYLRYAKGKSGIPSENFCSCIFFTPLVLSNMYKVIGIISWTAQRLEKNVTHLPLNLIQTALEKLYWISPLSWCNPFTQNPLKIILVQALICLGLSCTLFIYGQYCYEKKNYFLP